MIGSIVLSLILATTQPDTWTDLGEYRITTYCQYCNEPTGYGSASGVTLHSGCVAMNGVPLGATIAIDGEEYIVADRCGIDGTVDIFVESTTGYCHCDYLDYTHIMRKDEE